MFSSGRMRWEYAHGLAGCTASIDSVTPGPLRFHLAQGLFRESPAWISGHLLQFSSQSLNALTHITPPLAK